jgi:phenylpropionate dioxygenase-like ring-hydroxylating dioxygenase large terminal subunit
MEYSPLQQILKRALCEQPLTFLDPLFYVNPEIESLERQNIFSKTWQYVAHAAKLPHPGSVLTVEVAGRSLILLRSQKGELLAFYNACSHRGSALVSSNCSEFTHPVKCLVCPYHGWTFDTEGNLKGTPEKERFDSGVDIEQLSLKPVRLETWGPLIFVSLSQTVPSLKSFLGEAVGRMAGFPMAALIPLFSKDYDIACNWKTFHDNGLCDYHVNIAHKTTLKDVQGLTKHYQYAFDDYVNALITPITEAWQSANKTWEALSEPLRSEFVTLGIFPNLHVYALPDGTMYVERIDPTSSTTCRVHSEVYGLPHHLDNLHQLRQWYDELFEEDRAIAEGVQKGYLSIQGSIQGKSGLSKAMLGPINQLEARVIHQQQLIRRFLLSGCSKELTSPIGSNYSEIFRRSDAFSALMQRKSLPMNFKFSSD